MEKVLIFGAGNVGASIAYALLFHPAHLTIYLYDIAPLKALAQIEDLKDGNNNKQIFPYNGELVDIVINCSGNSAYLHEEDRDIELNTAIQSVNDIAKKISGFKGIFLNVSNPCDKVTALFGEVLSLPKARVFGTGTALEMERMKIRHPAGNFLIIGEHGDRNIILTEDKQIRDDIQTVRGIVWDIVRQKGNTCYGIANIAYQIIDAIVCDTKKEMVLCVYHKEGYYSDRCIVGKKGIEKINTPQLSHHQKKELTEIINNINLCTTPSKPLKFQRHTR